MGFFSDLKEDLSQAVNELLPGGADEKEKTEEAADEAQDYEDASLGIAGFEGEAEDFSEEQVSLDEMLQNIDSIQLPEELEEDEEDGVEWTGVDDLSEDDLAELEEGKEDKDESDVDLSDMLEKMLEEGSASGEKEQVISFEELTAQAEAYFASSDHDDKEEEEPADPENEVQEEEEAEALDAGTEEVSEKEDTSDAEKTDEAETETDAEETIPEEGEDQEAESATEEAESGLAATDMTQESVEEYIKNEEHKGARGIMEATENRKAIDETSIITAGMIITGDIFSEGSVEVVGTVNGNIDAYGKLNITGHLNGNSSASEIYAEGAQISGEVVSEGAVKIGASTVIIGNITATSAVIAGAVKGDIDVQGPVILDTSAIVMGNIKSKSVQINNGAVIEGMCSQCYADVNPTSFFDDYKPEFKSAK